MMDIAVVSVGLSVAIGGVLYLKIRALSRELLDTSERLQIVEAAHTQLRLDAEKMRERVFPKYAFQCDECGGTGNLWHTKEKPCVKCAGRGVI